MNRKGFTLIEVLAVILIMSIILVLAAPSISDAYKNSKLKSEEIFLERLSDIIDSYVKLKNSEIGFTSSGTANKNEKGSTYTVNIFKGTITVQNIIDYNLLAEEDYINAGNKEVSCNKDATIEVYRDSDYVYCHKVSKEAIGCLTEDYKNSITGDYVMDTCIWEEVE